MNRTIALSAAGAVGALALGFGIPALAADDSTDGSDSSRSELMEEMQAEHEAREAEFAQRLADELGVDVDEVTAALEKVRDDLQTEADADRTAALQQWLDDAVENGDLTQEEADSLKKLYESGDLPGGDRMGEGMLGGHGHGHGFGGPMMGGPLMGGPMFDDDDDASGSGSGSSSSGSGSGATQSSLAS